MVDLDGGFGSSQILVFGNVYTVVDHLEVSCPLVLYALSVFPIPVGRVSRLYDLYCGSDWLRTLQLFFAPFKMSVLSSLRRVFSLLRNTQ